MAATLAIIAVILLVAGISTAILRRQLSAERNAKLIATIDDQRRTVARADRVTFRALDIADKATEEALAIRKVSNQMDMLIRHAGVEEPLPHRGRHRPHIVPDNHRDTA